MNLAITSAGKRPLCVRLGAALLLGLATVSTAALAQATPNLGPNVLVFDPSMPTSQIQAAVDQVAATQVSNQFGTQRYALLFKPGVYGADVPLIIQVGFYTDVAGLGAQPGDVTINGHVDVYNQCFSANNCIALVNFWRSLSNLTIHVTGSTGCRSSADFWAVSQASPIRRVNMSGSNLTLFDYCTAGPQFASGGFIADSQIDTAGGVIINGSQQQFYVRNSDIGPWTNGVWNQVFTGVVGGGVSQTFPNPTYTVLPNTPVSREKPFLYIDGNGNYNVFAPALQTNSVGTSWTAAGGTPGRSLPISRFFIANPSTSLQEINSQLASGQNLILTPGVYQYAGSIDVKRPDTVVLGLGLATLVPQAGTAAITVSHVDGVQVAGLIIDAGPVNSPVLFQVGKPNGEKPSNAADPTTLSDVYFRIGGATVGTATTSLQVDQDNVILDNIWAWRADHGAGALWAVNLGDHGLVVNGNNVTATGLFVEHYQKEQVLWNGNGGETIFYQSELPYDPPTQADWTDGSANGFPSYVVSNGVTSHQAYGLGIYSFFDPTRNNNNFIIDDNAMTVPVVPGVTVHDAGSVWLSGTGQITHVINGVGGTANKATGGQLHPVVTYP
jgi:hypothetical protein